MAQTKAGAAITAAKKIGISLDEYNSKCVNQKHCCKCKLWKDRDHFHVDNSRSDKLAAKCHGCVWKNGGKRGAKKGRPSPMKGKHFSAQAVENIRRAAKITGEKRIGTTKTYTPEGYINLIKAVSKPRPSTQGEKNSRWKGGHDKTSSGQRELNKIKLRKWRISVYERDDYTCQDCGDSTGGNLQAHHIKEFAIYIELRYEVSNGVTLCKECHEKRHFNPNSTRNKKKTKMGIPLKF